MSSFSWWTRAVWSCCLILFAGMRMSSVEFRLTPALDGVSLDKPVEDEFLPETLPPPSLALEGDPKILPVEAWRKSCCITNSWEVKTPLTGYRFTRYSLQFEAWRHWRLELGLRVENIVISDEPVENLLETMSWRLKAYILLEEAFGRLNWQP